jgi:hypothetical protein
MNSGLNYKIDFVFIITPHILLKHNNYLYQNIKMDNYFIETLIYDYSDPLNNLKNYYFTLQKILKIAILRKYNNIMILHSDILFKNNWMNILNSLINTELGIIKNDFSVIWLQSEQEYFTDYQLNEISYKQYYTFNLINDKNNNMTTTFGNDGLIISEKVYMKLYNQIKKNLLSNDINELKLILSYTCTNTNSFILYPNILINIKKIEPLCLEVNKIILNKEKKYIASTNHKYLNPILKNLVIQTCNISLNSSKNDIINDLNNLKELTSQDIIDEINDENLLKLYNDFIIPYKILNYIYNPNHFNIYYNFNKEIIDHFDWLFYKYYYDDIINNDLINSYEDTMCHYLNYGYKELRYICIDEYLYDKNDNELEQNIKAINIQIFYEENKEKIDNKNLSKKPILYYVKYMYDHIAII